jgi:hypothetical protein
MGMEKTDDPDYPINCMNLLNFGGNKLTIEKLSVDYRIFISNASVSDEGGNLLFYSNGCDVKNANHEIMPNGEGLNPGSIYNDNCPDGGYTSDGLIILPSSNDSNKYYIFHQAYEVYNESPYVRTNRLYYSIVDMTLDNGMGDVTTKNQVVLKNTLYTGLQ